MRVHAYRSDGVSRAQLTAGMPLHTSTPALGGNSLERARWRHLVQRWHDIWGGGAWKASTQYRKRVQNVQEVLHLDH
eukprot:scaffold41057_cov45-Phaeocystis_antarctica.AAC.1